MTRQDKDVDTRQTPEPNVSEIDRVFNELYREHLRDVYSYAYYKIGNHHDAEDLTEQTFLQAYRHLGRAIAESRGRPMRPWLIRIAQNLAANYYRDRARRPQSNLEDLELSATKHQTAEVAADRERLERLIALIDQMSGDRREALIMRFALGMDNTEIARALDRSAGSTKVLIHRAIKQLEQEMEEE